MSALGKQMHNSSERNLLREHEMVIIFQEMSGLMGNPAKTIF